MTVITKLNVDDARFCLDLLPLWEYCKIPEKRPFMLKSVFNALPCFYLAEHSMAACKVFDNYSNLLKIV